MAFFGHDMLKRTELYGNLPNVSSLKRVMTKKDRLKFKARFDMASELYANVYIFFMFLHCLLRFLPVPFSILFRRHASQGERSRRSILYVGATARYTEEKIWRCWLPILLDLLWPWWNYGWKPRPVICRKRMFGQKPLWSLNCDVISCHLPHRSQGVCGGGWRRGICGPFHVAGKGQVLMDGRGVRW